MHTQLQIRHQEIEELKTAFANFRHHKTGRYFPSELRNRALQLVDSGMAAVAVARSIGVNKNAVYAWRDQRESQNSVAVSDITPPRVLRVQDALEAKPNAIEMPQTLRLQVGAFDITVALRAGAA